MFLPWTVGIIDKRDGVSMFECVKEAKYEFPKEFDPKDFKRP